MRIGIYNRWLATLGGGEKYDLTIAECLSRQHQVEVISHQRVDKAYASERLQVDLSRVEFVILPNRSALEMTPVTREYDFFINGSYLDFFPCLAPRSAAVVFFPSNLGPDTFSRRWLKTFVRRQLRLPQVMVSPQAYNLAGGGPGWVGDADIKLRLPAMRKPYALEFDLRAVHPAVTQAHLYLDGLAIEQVEVSRTAHCRVLIPRLPEKKYHELVISPVVDGEPGEGQARLRLENLSLGLWTYRFYQRLLEKNLLRMQVRLEYSPPGMAILEYLDTYSAIWSISEYTTKWIWRYWKRDSSILYPPVNVESYTAGEKRPQILNVGRFFAGNHNKKHLVMVDAFKRMVDQGLTGWTLHLAGGVSPGEEHKAYLDSVFEQASHYPITIHPDIPYAELSALYSNSAIYWHASGFGEDDQRDPEKYEHFGITTVESMSAGCVPVVIAKGGQPEIVQHGENGFLWNTLEELQQFTHQLMVDPALTSRLSQQAVHDSRQYSTAAFYRRVNQLIAGDDAMDPSAR
jgi:glycosyltransferase involved in cell wall biosynthesis